MCLRADIQKVNSFARSEFSLIKFWAELCAEIAIKHIRFEKIWSNCDKNKKKCFFWQVSHSKVKKLPKF